MKKFFVVVSVLMALVFMAGPSNALIGVEDPVSGNGFRLPFLVAMGATGMDTLFMYQETSGNAALFGTGLPGTPQRGVASWILWTPGSVHAADGTRIFTRGDVDALSIRDLILNFMGPAQQAACEIDLNGDGINDHWFGYMTVWTTSTAVGWTNLNNMFGYVQFVDLANGQAAGTIATHYEVATAAGYVPFQDRVASAGGGAANWPDGLLPGSGGWHEVMSPNAYATSWRREAGLADGLVGLGSLSTFVRFTPRWYLHDALGQSYVLLYKGLNHNAPGQSNTINVRYWDANEFNLSGAINVPLEMTILNMRLILPAAMFAAYPAGGWVDIRQPDPILGAQLRWPLGVVDPVTGLATAQRNWDQIEWLCWVWNIANSPVAATNWSALWVDKEIGT